MTPRWLPLTGALNARDLGGLPLKGGGLTRHGVLLRSDTLQELTADDVAWLQAARLRTVIDLRTPAEAAREGRGPLADTEVAYANLPFIPDEVVIPDDPRHEVIVADRQERDRVEHYLDYLRLAAPRVVAALDLLASPGASPALFHCAAGKDRTGVLAAIVLEMNGVEREAIIADFALTNETAARRGATPHPAADLRTRDAPDVVAGAAGGPTDHARFLTTCRRRPRRPDHLGDGAWLGHQGGEPARPPAALTRDAARGLAKFRQRGYSACYDSNNSSMDGVGGRGGEPAVGDRRAGRRRPARVGCGRARRQHRGADRADRPAAGRTAAAAGRLRRAGRGRGQRRPRQHRLAALAVPHRRRPGRRPGRGRPRVGPDAAAHPGGVGRRPDQLRPRPGAHLRHRGRAGRAGRRRRTDAGRARRHARTPPAAPRRRALAGACGARGQRPRRRTRLPAPPAGRGRHLRRHRGGQRDP